MLSSCIYACYWLCVIMFSLVGYGYAVSFFSSKSEYKFGLLGVFGLSFSIIVGGILNVYKIISPDLIKAYLYFGVFICLFFIFKNLSYLLFSIKKIVKFLLSDKLYLFFSLFLFLFLMARVLLSVSFYGFHGADDYRGYTVFPVKMIQTGEIGNDPFSERRIVSSLGGKYFLDTFVLSSLDTKFLHIIDNCVSYLFYIILIVQLLFFAKLNKYLKLLIFTLPLVTASPTGNITSVITSLVLFLGLLVFILFVKKGYFEGYFLVPLVAAATIVSKSNMIVPTSILVLYYYVVFFKERNLSFSFKTTFLNVVRYMFLPFVIIFTMILPWMISLLFSSGTLLYPILGKGFHGTTYGTFLSHYFSFDFYSFIRLAFELYGALCLLLPLSILIAAIFIFNTEKKKVFLLFIFSALLGVLALIYATGGYSLYYYSFSFVMPVLLCILITLPNESDIGKKNKITILVFVVTAFMLGIYFQKGLDIFQEIKSAVSFDGGMKVGLMNRNENSSLEISQYKNLQNSIPEKERILVVLDKNFLLDFKRNTIYIADSPGAASLPPGIPMFRGEKELTSYLLSKNIRYVACSCGKKASFSKSFISGMLKAHVNPWLKTETMNFIDFYDNFQNLNTQKRVLYDDGANIVLDISLEK